MCPFCHSQGVPNKPLSPGQPYCGRTCAKAAGQAGWVDGKPPAAVAAPAPAPAAVAPGMCPFCHSQGIKKRVSPGQPYCGKTCGKQAAKAGWVGGQPPAASPAPSPGGNPVTGGAAPGMCPFCHSQGIPNKPLSPGQPYCGRTCAKAAHQAGWVDGVDPSQLASGPAAAMCRQCQARPALKTHPFCNRGCADAYKKNHIWVAKPKKLANNVEKYTITHGGTQAGNTEDSIHFNRAFTQYGILLQGSRKQVTQIEYYHNPQLQANFDRKQAEFKKAGKDDTATWIFHGSAAKNIPLIMEGGFKVGGKVYNGKKFPVSNGTAHGQGVYSATGPNTPMGYSGSQSSGGQIILAMALKGNHGHGTKNGNFILWVFVSIDDH